MHDSQGNRETTTPRPCHSEYTASTELMSRFTEQAKILTLPREHVFFRMGEESNGVYLILNGEIELRLPLVDGSAIAFRAERCCLIGLPAAFTDEPYSMTGVALTELEIAVMKPEDFCRLVESNPSFSFEVLRILAGETRGVRAAIRSL